MVARWSANPLAMLWPERDAAFCLVGWRRRAGRGARVASCCRCGVDPSDGECDAGLQGIGSVVSHIQRSDGRIETT
jgi:hypothetical protein